ncbi:very long chain fatty acid elongase 4-like [Watersipora subatra]|uniref:very long chain fatty acid elongase 4-like n=1 Tax=Watersipora subatra TaxID=2589382 RepID=UPI00355B10DE
MASTEKVLPGLIDCMHGSFTMFFEPLHRRFYAEKDPRVDGWLMMSSPYPTFILFVLYLLLVWQGPKYMAQRQAFNLQYILIIYNLMLVLLSAYMLYEFAATTFGNPDFNIWCSPVDRSDNILAVRLAKAVWWYYFSKPIEFLDTLFFVLRKKNNQISFLHVYHHSTMPLLWWVGARYLPGGCAYFSAMLNSGVHTLMYSYYMLSAMGPRVRKFLWWKKYMTAIQLIQFWLILLHTANATYTDCGYPTGYGIALIIYVVSHIFLFTDFYNNAYRVSADAVKGLSSKENSKITPPSDNHVKED